jgi:hypothetical protein
MPGVIVTSGGTQQAAGVSLQLGTLFVVAPAAYGPEETTLIQGLAAGVELYGPREGESIKLYDALDRYFALGGARAYVKRIAGEGSPAAAKLELETTGKKKTLVVSAKYKGVYGNSLKIEVVENAGKTATKLVVVSAEGEVLQTSGEYAKAEELLTWGKTHETYVVITEASEYAGGKAEKLEKLASTKLASGANPTVSSKSTITSIEAIPKALGPGQLIVPGNTEEAVHVAMAEHGFKNKRDAQADLKGAEEAGTTIASLKSEKGTIPSGVAQNINFFAQALQAPGLAGGTTRTIPASVVAAALFARVARTGNNAQAPAGVKWPIGPQITGLVNTYSESQMTSLEESGINSFAEITGVLCLYGAASALPASKSEVLSQYSAVREVIAIELEAEEAGQQYLFDSITADTIAEFAGDLSGIIKRQKEAKAVEGGEVKVGSPINTPETARAKQLNAEMVVVIAGVAVTINIRVTSASNVESI